MGKSKLVDALILLRIPFSFFLMPVFWFALSQLPEIAVANGILVFIILHIFVYPASNGYNSLHDKDTSSIGGLKNPPPVNGYLKYLVWTLDLAAVLLSLIISPGFAIMVAIYLLVSKSYSNTTTRIKKYPWLSAAVVSVFQGGFIYIAVAEAVSGVEIRVLSHEVLIPAVVSSLFLLGSYPLTQVYQHAEDGIHGDVTLSMKLGVAGTFLFSGVVMFIGAALLAFYLYRMGSVTSIIIFLVAMAPVLFVFNNWFSKVKINFNNADYANTMLMNKVSSICLSSAFILMKVFE